MKMIRIIFVVVATTGLISVLSAFTVSHAIYVQVKILKTEMASPENMAKADSLTRFTDQACAFFGIVGAVQLAGALIGSAALRRLRQREK